MKGLTVAQAAEIYNQAVIDGNAHRAIDTVAKAGGFSRSTAHRRINAARANDELVILTEHRPRRARWVTGAKRSWVACAECQVPWPCPSESFRRDVEAGVYGPPDQEAS